jgi:hypothetical protein
MLGGKSMIFQALKVCWNECEQKKCKKRSRSDTVSTAVSDRYDPKRARIYPIPEQIIF